MNKLFLILAFATLGTSCIVSKKHKERSHIEQTTSVKAVTTASVTTTAQIASKDTLQTANVTTVDTRIDTSITVPSSLIAGAGKIKDGDIKLPDGSEISWIVDSASQTISVKASTPASQIPINLHKTQTTRSNTTAIDSHAERTEAQQEAKTTTVASATVVANKDLKTKDVTAYTPSMSAILGVSVILVALLLIFYLKRGRPA